jgi:hypothetical protein
MNEDDRKSLAAFKNMFTALSSSVRKKFEAQQNPQPSGWTSKALAQKASSDD